MKATVENPVNSLPVLFTAKNNGKIFFNPQNGKTQTNVTDEAAFLSFRNPNKESLH